jgi:hypothetical protein
VTIDVTTQGSPGWYLKRLSDKLERRRNDTIDDLFARYEGNAPVPTSLRDAPDSAKKFFKASRTSFAEMIVKAVKYPLRLQSVQTTVDDSETGDDEAWRMVRRSGMLTESDDVHRLSLVAGDGYAITAMYEGQARYTAEDPRQVVTIHDPVVQAIILAAGKFFHHEEDERDYAYLYRPGRVYRAYFVRKNARGRTRFSSSWTWDEQMGGAEGQALPGRSANLMPVFRYRDEEGVGEFQRHRDLLDRLDHMVLQGMTIATLQAFRQRAIKVSEEDMPEKDEETGKTIDYNDVFSSDPGALWKLPETAELWESGNVDLSPIWTGMEKFIQQLSAVTFTPLAMFSPDGQNQSAAGASFAREGRTFKIEDRQDRYGAVHAAAIAALHRISGDASRANPEDIDVIWRPAERYGLAEKADASVKAKSADVPWETRMRDIWQYSAAQIQRMRAERTDDLALANLIAATAPAPSGSTAPADPEPAATGA